MDCFLPIQENPFQMVDETMEKSFDQTPKRRNGLNQFMIEQQLNTAKSSIIDLTNDYSNLETQGDDQLTQYDTLMTCEGEESSDEEDQDQIKS